VGHEEARNGCKEEQLRRQKEVKNEMHRYKRGKAKSGPGGKGGKVKSRTQTIAIGLSKAPEGKRVPAKKK
jgi:uncharacterized protein DUF6496